MTSKSRLLRITLATLTLPLAALLLINLWDKPLKPEVTKILTAPDVPAGEDARRAYEFMADVETRDPNLWRAVFGHCGEAPGDACGARDLTPENLKILAEAAPALDSYVRLMEFGDFAPLEPTGEGDLFDPVAMPYPGVHRLFTLRLASWLKAGGGERVWRTLELSNRFYSAVLTRGEGMLPRMIAMVELGANARFIEAELKRNPRWTPPKALIESIALPDINDVLGGALAGEVRGVNRLLRLQGRTWRGLFLRPHETLNRFFDLESQTLFTDCPTAGEDCVPGLAELDRGARRYLVNQAGYPMLRILLLSSGIRAKLIQRTRTILDLKREFRARL